MFLQEKDFFWKESQVIPDLKKAVKAQKARLGQVTTEFEQERATLTGKLNDVTKELQAAETVRPNLLHKLTYMHTYIHAYIHT